MLSEIPSAKRDLFVAVKEQPAEEERGEPS
jgi:hypothetical protein